MSKDVGHDGSDIGPPNNDEVQRIIDAEVQRYQKAVREEFALSEATPDEATIAKTAITSLEAYSNDIRGYTRDFFSRYVPQAAAQIVFLAFNSQKDAVRANLSKYIIDMAQEPDPTAFATKQQVVSDLIDSLK